MDMFNHCYYWPLGTGTSVWRMMVIGKWIEASNEQVGTWTGPPAGSNTAAAYPPAELAFVILRMVNAEDADYKASESQGCRFEGQ